MKFHVLARVALLSIGICGFLSPNLGRADEPNGDGTAFSVMTWNLEWFYDEYVGDSFSKLARQKAAPSREAWNWRRDAIASSVAAIKPTILAVQEVENRRVLWYLSRSLDRNHQTDYREYGIEGRDHYTEQDVGFLVRKPANVVSICRRSLDQKQSQSERYRPVSKHLFLVLEVPIAGRRERITLVNAHLRARPEAEAERTAQARSLHHWIKPILEAGEHVIVIGDINTEEDAGRLRQGSDIFVLSGRETPSTDDDLIDLLGRLPEDQRRTHLLPNRQYDRILVSRSLVENESDKADLVVGTVETLPDLAIRGERDDAEEHWENYWGIKRDVRDLSDHVPVLATFKVH